MMIHWLEGGTNWPITAMAKYKTPITKSTPALHFFLFAKPFQTLFTPVFRVRLHDNDLLKTEKETFLCTDDNVIKMIPVHTDL